MKKYEMVMSEEQYKLLESMTQVFQDGLYELLPVSSPLLWEVTRLRFILRHAMHNSKEVRE